MLTWAVFAFAGSLVFSAHQDSALVPVLAEERLARPKEIPRLLGTVLGHTWVIGGVLSVLVAAGATIWFSFRYEGEDLSLARTMAVPFTLYLLAMSTRTFFSTLLATEKRYFVQPVASALGMATAIGILVAGHARYGVVLIPVASLAGEIANVGVLSWFALRIAEIRIELNLSRPAALTSVARLIAADVGGASITRINLVVDQLMAGLSVIAGAGTMLRFSGDVSSVPTSLLQAALLPVLLSHLSDQFAKKDYAAARSTLRRTLFVVCGLLLLATALLWVTSLPLCRLIYLHGKMDEAGVAGIAELLPYHLVGLAPFGALLVLARAHIALKNTTIFVSAGIFNAVSNAFFNVVLLRAIGLPGLALATSCVQAVVALLLWVRLRSKLAELTARPSVDTAGDGETRAA